MCRSAQHSCSAPIREALTGDEVHSRDGLRALAIIAVVAHHIFSVYFPGGFVSGAAPPPCNARFDRQDANQLGQIGSHIWLTI
jgi:peptidoglycan/LPS O-acetylase OafA/YrhL